mgnify:CR=1 FL=1
MGASLALDTLHQAGLSARLDGDRLILSPARLITPELRKLVRAHKPELMESIGGPTANDRTADPLTVDVSGFRRWRVIPPDGEPDEVDYAPPTTREEVARFWPPGAALEPLPDTTLPKPGPELPAPQEAAVRRWLRFVDEQDPDTIGEILRRCQHNPSAREYFLRRASEVPEHQRAICCASCRHAQETTHPALVGCAAGIESADPTGRHWKADRRSCNKWGPRP